MKPFAGCSFAFFAAVVWLFAGLGCSAPPTRSELIAKYGKESKKDTEGLGSRRYDDAIGLGVRWSEAGYYNVVNRWGVNYQAPDKQRFLDENWQLDNFKCERQESGRCRWSIKKGTAYKGLKVVDRDDDGTLEEESTYFFDIKLVNKRDDGVIWMRTDELSVGAAESYLEVFLNNYVDSLEGAQLAFSGSPLGLAKVKERKFVANVESKEERKLGGYDALVAVVSLADVDKLRMDPDHRHLKIKVLISKVDTSSKVISCKVEEKCREVDPTGNGRHTAISCKKEEQTCEYADTSGKSVLIAGYLSSPEYFDNGAKYLDQLATQMYFGGRRE